MGAGEEEACGAVPALGQAAHPPAACVLLLPLGRALSVSAEACGWAAVWLSGPVSAWFQACGAGRCRVGSHFQMEVRASFRRQEASCPSATPLWLGQAVPLKGWKVSLSQEMSLEEGSHPKSS